MRALNTNRCPRVCTMSLKILCMISMHETEPILTVRRYFLHDDEYVGISAFVNEQAKEADRNAVMLAVGALMPLSHGRMGKSWKHADGLKELAKYVQIQIFFWGNVDPVQTNVTRLQEYQTVGRVLGCKPIPQPGSTRASRTARITVGRQGEEKKKSIVSQWQSTHKKSCCLNGISTCEPRPVAVFTSSRSFITCIPRCLRSPSISVVQGLSVTEKSVNGGACACGAGVQFRYETSWSLLHS